MQIGCFLSCEEFGPSELVELARRAEQAGFHALWISDHYHPWNDEQGHSPFVWSVIGALAEATSLPVTTGVTCPTVRIHPALIAQAAATSGVLHQGRFQLGVGSGEALNEHILGDRWPEAGRRRRTSSRRASWSRASTSPHRSDPTSSSTWSPCSRTPTPGSTSCSSSRSGPTRTRSSRPGRAGCCRASDDGEVGGLGPGGGHAFAGRALLGGDPLRDRRRLLVAGPARDPRQQLVGARLER